MQDQLDLFLAPPTAMLKGIFIPGNVPSLKNNKKIIQIRPKGRPPIPRLVPSDRHAAYAKAVANHFLYHKQAFRNAAKTLPKPLRIAFQFIRDSRRAFDYTNAMDTVQDLMVEHGWIPDDNCNEMIPVPVPYLYSKERPGVIIAPIG